MALVEITVPELSESVVEATVAEWRKQVGEAVQTGDVLVVLDTDKVSLEVTAEQDGVLAEILAPEGSDVPALAVLGHLNASGEAVAAAPKAAPAASAPAAVSSSAAPAGVKATPVAKRAAEALNVDLKQVSASEGGKVTKSDVEKYAQAQQQPAPTKPAATPAPAAPAPVPSLGGRREERVRMTRRRRTIAKRLVDAQSIAAMLTTFNEVDMSPVMELRKRWKDPFKEKFGVSLGLSSFFVKATIGALKLFPALNAEIDGDEIIYKHFYDIGIAVGAEEGLVVPVLRDADRLSFAEIERQVRDYAKQASEGTLSIESLMGGTFTITNGGVFGSLLSTPILNYPQVGILGLHGIKDRPVVVGGEIVIRPMMNLALTYDHRIVDGREAVQFLVRVKDLIEDPEKLLLEG